MTASNLGIIFGPTLIKPRQGDAEVSLSSLVDYPYQALIVELLIRHYQMVFDTPLSPLGSSSPMERKSRTRLTPQEKEQQLSRHSKSMGDIKEVKLVYKKLMLKNALVVSLDLGTVRRSWSADLNALA